MTVDIDRWAGYLLAAADECRAVPAITRQVDSLGIDDAYAIQAALLERRLDRGESVAGAKLGLTSAAKQQQMGVDEPVYGFVLESSLLPAGADLALDELIHPRAEPELVFRLAEDLSGPGIEPGDVMDATAEIVGGIEVIDSRFEAFSFTLPDVIADNTSAARVALGASGVAPGDVDLSTLGCVFEIDGAVAATATGAALLGDPARCVAMLANHLGRNGGELAAGWVVLAGAPTDAHAIGEGTRATARYSHMASVTVTGVR